MNAPNKRFGQAIKALATHAADHEALECLIVEFSRPDLLRRNEKVHGHPDFAWPRKQTGCGKGEKFCGREHEDPVGHLVKLAVCQDPCTLPRLVGRQFVIEDSSELCDAVTGRLFGQKAVRAAIHDESTLLRRIRYNLRPDLATRGVGPSRSATNSTSWPSEAARVIL